MSTDDKSTNDRVYCSPADVIATLSHLMPDIAPYWDRPLCDFAHAAYSVPHATSSRNERTDAMERLQNCIVQAASRSGFSREDAKSAGLQLASSPVLQTGPHCHLVIEPDAFYTHLFAVLGLTSHARRWHISYSVSTVKFTEKAKKGPGWLRLEGEAVNVFGLSRSEMVPYSICGLNGPYRFSFSNRTGGAPANGAAAELKAMLPAADFHSAAEAIKAANQSLWSQFFSEEVRFLQIDDIDVADLVAEHLEDTRSWLATYFIGDDRFAEIVLAEIDRLNSGNWTGWIRRTTDFFWGLVGGRIYPLHLKHGVLSSTAPHLDFSVRFAPREIAEALRQRKIVPNMLTAFLVTSILPGVRVLGGCRQTVYYPLMRYLIAIALESVGQNGLVAALRSDVHPGMWGHRVLRPDDADPYGEVVQSDGNLATLLEIYANRSLKLACGNLASFTHDPIWATLAAHVAVRNIQRTCPQWLWR